MEKIRKKILESEQPVADMAASFLRKKIVLNLSRADWQALVDDIPEDVEKAICAQLQSSGTNTHQGLSLFCLGTAGYYSRVHLGRCESSHLQPGVGLKVQYRCSVLPHSFKIIVIEIVSIEPPCQHNRW